MKWINIKDRLPEHEHKVDIWTNESCRFADCLYTHYTDSTPHFYYEPKDIIIPIQKVTHWMPLPEPPKKEK
jgi:hypothetical protein